MKEFALDRRWSEPRNELFVDMIYDKIRDHTRHNPISTAAIARWCKSQGFPDTFNAPDTIRQVVSFLRRHHNAPIGTCNRGTWIVTDVEGWHMVMESLNKRLRVLQATYSAMLTTQIAWYRKRKIKFTDENQTELPL